ncbi:MAG: hypothetical protein AVDCRST_MAG67-1922, partial [uncultured Solirubrobacteraceae bacterium]
DESPKTSGQRRHVAADVRTYVLPIHGDLWMRSHTSLTFCRAIARSSGRRRDGV